MSFTNPESLKDIIILNAKKLNIKIETIAAFEIAKRSRGTPRIAIRLLKRILDFSIVQSSDQINMNTVEESLKQMRIDSEGLDEMDRKYLNVFLMITMVDLLE